MGQACDPTSGQCASFCNTNVHCPDGEKCVEPSGCVPVCQGVSCPTSFACDPKSGQCVDTSCANITCFPPQTCMGGICVTPDGGGTGGSGAGGSGNGGSGNGGAPETSSSSSSGAPGAAGKCGCRVPGDTEEAPLSGAGALALLGIAAAFMRKRR
jgi:MYXO-CTERM domain-containing protein